MPRLPLPRSLFARLMLIWLLGIAVVLAVSFWLFIGERDRASRAALVEGLTQQITTAVEVLDHASASERRRWIAEFGRHRLRFSLETIPSDLAPLATSHPVASALRAAFPDRDIKLFALRPERPRPMIAASLNLADGTQLQMRMPDLARIRVHSPPGPRNLAAALTALLAGVGLLTWLAVRLATRPLSRMAEAARALGEDPERPALDTAGPAEVAQAAQAFNQMQQRIREHVSERTRILAAISHDLQTPITRLRLRAELVEDETLRSRIQSDLDGMQALVKEGLAYARSLDDRAPAQPIDLQRLLEALCDDSDDMGWAVSLQGSAPLPVLGQPTALRRALWNLIENGIKFGGRVSIALSQDTEATHIRIRDQGPGLAEADLDKVFEPFYRTESSRNRDTGGTGLGLSIARNLLRHQSGELKLRNHPQGGLEAIVRLRTSAAAQRRQGRSTPPPDSPPPPPSGAPSPRSPSH